MKFYKAKLTKNGNFVSDPLHQVELPFAETYQSQVFVIAQQNIVHVYFLIWVCYLKIGNLWKKN